MFKSFLLWAARPTGCFAILLIVSVFLFGQDLESPMKLGALEIADGDPSEFLLHSVMEYSSGVLESYSQGKLLVRLCSRDKFERAFVKAPVSPLAASYYNQYQLLVPYEKIFVASSTKCGDSNGLVVNEYWLFKDKITVETDDIFSVKDISHRTFGGDDWSDCEAFTSKKRKRHCLNDKFTTVSDNFIDALKKDQEGLGFVVYNSKSKRMRRNLKKIKARILEEDMGLTRVEFIRNPVLVANSYEKTKIERNDKAEYPRLAILSINGQN